MAFKFLKERAKKREMDFYMHVQKKTIERFHEGSLISLEEYKTLRMNSYDRRVLEPLFTDEVLCFSIEYALEQEGNSEFVKYTIPSSYTESILRVHIHELLRRFRGTKGGMDNGSIEILLTM